MAQSIPVKIEVEIKTLRVRQNPNRKKWQFWKPKEIRETFDSIEKAMGAPKVQPLSLDFFEKAFTAEYGPRRSHAEQTKFINLARRLGLRKET